MVAGPELSRVVNEFEGVQNELAKLPHHQEGRASQRRFSVMSEIKLMLSL